jgi:DNA-binding PadR family transcriptional regulator
MGHVKETSLSTDRDLYAGLIRLHVLHHAGERPIYGAWIIRELSHHGYSLSPGTLYPLLHGLEGKGYLRSRKILEGRRARRIYSMTTKGRRAFAQAKDKVRELFGELFEKEFGQAGFRSTTGKRPKSQG